MDPKVCSAFTELQYTYIHDRASRTVTLSPCPLLLVSPIPPQRQSSAYVLHRDAYGKNIVVCRDEGLGLMGEGAAKVYGVEEGVEIDLRGVSRRVQCQDLQPTASGYRFLV